MGNREAEAITLDTTSKVYRKQLAQALSIGELHMAESKAAFLQKLCDELHFNPQKAAEIHEGNLLYVILVMFTISWNFATCNARNLNTLTFEVIFMESIFLRM